jgi:cobalt-zinc-cadmium efflux system outer membrane protein
MPQSRIGAALLPAFLFCLTPAPGSAQPHDHAALPAAQAEQPLTLADLEALALRHNPTLTQAAAQVAASRAKAQQAGLYPNPTVGYVGDLIGVQGTAGELQGGFLQQTIITGGKLRLSRAKYNQQAYEAEIRAQGQQLRVVNGVHTRHAELLALQRMIELRRQLLANAEESLRTHREMFNTGQANRSEVLLAEVEVSRARIALRTLENRHLALWQGLAALVGAPDLPPAPLAGQLEPEGPPLEWPASLARLLQDSPELLAAQAHVGFDQIMLRRERAEPIPNVSVQAATGRNFENPGTVAGVQLGIEVPLFDRNQGTVRQVKADLARDLAEVRRVELSLRQRLATAFSHYQTALETVQLFREINLPKAAEAAAVMREMYQKRRAPWMEVVKLERTVLEVQAEYTQSLLELRKMQIAICGLLLVDGLSEPLPPPPAGHIDAVPKPR